MERPSIVSVGMNSAPSRIAVYDVSIYGVPKAGDGTRVRHTAASSAW